MTSLAYGLDTPYEVQLEHNADNSNTYMTILETQRTPKQHPTQHYLTPGVYMVSLTYNGASQSVLRHEGGGVRNGAWLPAGAEGIPRTSAPIKISVQSTNEYLRVAAPHSDGLARATISVIPAATFDEMAESTQGVSVLSEISNLKSTKADKSTLDARVPADMSLSVDTSVGTRIFAGNTMIFSDTGLRALVTWDDSSTVVSGELPTGISPRVGHHGGIYIRRKLGVVTLYIVSGSASSTAPIIPIPLGFRAGFPYPSLVASARSHSKTIYATAGSTTVNLYGVEVGDTLGASSRFFGSTITWEASEGWPSTLPGLPA